MVFETKRLIFMETGLAISNTLFLEGVFLLLLLEMVGGMIYMTMELFQCFTLCVCELKKLTIPSGGFVCSCFCVTQQAGRMIR